MKELARGKSSEVYMVMVDNYSFTMIGDEITFVQHNSWIKF